MPVLTLLPAAAGRLCDGCDPESWQGLAAYKYHALGEDDAAQRLCVRCAVDALSGTRRDDRAELL